MKKVTYYQCEICERNYHSEKEALTCESRGMEETLVKSGEGINVLEDMEGPKKTKRKANVLSVRREGHLNHYHVEILDTKEQYRVASRIYHGNENLKEGLVEENETT